MAANDFGIVPATTPTILNRSEQVGVGAGSVPIIAQIVLVADSPELIPNLTGAGVVLSVTTTMGELIPPTAGARSCWIRAWETTGQLNKRLFYHRKNVTITADGANSEGFLLHTEGRKVCIANFSDFNVIAETGSAWVLYCEWSNLT